MYEEFYKKLDKYEIEIFKKLHKIHIASYFDFPTRTVDDVMKLIDRIHDNLTDGISYYDFVEYLEIRYGHMYAFDAVPTHEIRKMKY